MADQFSLQFVQEAGTVDSKGNASMASVQASNPDSRSRRTQAQIRQDNDQALLKVFRSLSDNGFSLRTFLLAAFDSLDSRHEQIKSQVNVFYSKGGPAAVLRVWGRTLYLNRQYDSTFITEAIDIVTNRTEADLENAVKNTAFRHPTNSISRKSIRDFSLDRIRSSLEHSAPHLTHLLSSLVPGKEGSVMGWRPPYDNDVRGQAIYNSLGNVGAQHSGRQAPRSLAERTESLFGRRSVRAQPILDSSGNFIERPGGRRLPESHLESDSSDNADEDLGGGSKDDSGSSSDDNSLSCSDADLQRDSEWEDEAKPEEIRDPRSFIATVGCMLLFMKSQKSNCFQMMMGIHLRGMSTPKRLIQLLSKLGLSMSYTSTTQCLKALARDNLKLVRRAAAKRPVIFLYDNINRKVTHRNQRKDKQDYFENSTTGTIVIGKYLGEDKPAHLMKKPSLMDIAIDAEDSKYYRQVTLSLFVKNIKSIHNSPFQTKFSIPDIALLKLKRTKAYELAAMDIDQASLQGNLQILDHMRRVLNKTKASFRNLKMIIAGDQLTISRIQGIQERSVCEATYFDLMRWAIPVLQLFHMQMILCSTILKTHFGHISQPGSLSYYIPLLGRRQLNKDMPSYYVADDFFRVVFDAMTTRMWDSKTRAFPGPTPMEEDAFEKEINAIIDQLLVKSTTLFSTTSTTNANAIIFMRDMTVYIEFCTAIKAGDIGRIELILKRITLMLNTGDHKNYGLELLRFMYNSQHVWSTTRKTAIFSSLLMNTSGHHNHWIPSDLYQEHNNLLTKQTHATIGNKWSTMNYITPNIRLFHEVASKINKEFKLTTNSPYHRSSSRDKDSRYVLRSLEEHDILGIDLNPEQHQRYPYTTQYSADLMTTGMEELVHGGYLKFIRRMNEERLEEELALDRNLDELMKELDEEVMHAGTFLHEQFSDNSSR